MAQTVTAEQLARLLYDALAVGDREALEHLLHPDFAGTLADGMPFALGGTRQGVADMWEHGWGAIGRHFAARARPERFLPLTDGRLLVTGRYTGKGRRGGSAVDAGFAHLITITDGRISALEQYTDTARWAEAASPFITLSMTLADGLATVRLNRPDHANAINPAMTKDLSEVATRLREDSSVRAVLLAGNGPMFTAGGDLALFAGLADGELPPLLRRMIDDYHLALERFTELDAPVVAAVHGAAAGGGMGLLYVADIAIAAEDTTFALGYGGIGLTSDGGNSWFLPRLVGLRRAQELFLLNRRFTAAEALEWGLVTRVVPAADVDAEALAVATRLATGPTRAYGGMRALLRRSFETGLREQLAAEKDLIVDAAATEDATEGIAAFAAKRRPTFTGR